jgi:Tfp pilus assembly protein PilN
MVNLLPTAHERSLKRDYYLRLISLVALMLSLVIFLGGLLLIPSYFLARASADASTRYVAALEETVGLRERSGVGATVATLAERVRILNEYAAAPVTPGIVTALIGAMPKGIALTSLSITRTSAGASVSINGSAASRDALLSFATALKDVHAFSGVALPVSQLASDKDIPFSLSFIFTPAP